MCAAPSSRIPDEGGARTFRSSSAKIGGRPHPPPAHVICGGKRTLGRALYFPPQNLGWKRSIFSAVAKSKDYRGGLMLLHQSFL